MTFEEIIRSHQRINDLSRSLIKRPAFDDLHVTIPDPSKPEPGFIRATSWLYCLYFEAGKVSLKFLRDLGGKPYSLIDKEWANEHFEVVRCLRTELNHNLGFADSDQLARTYAENWRRKACGTAMPRGDEDWKKCYESLIVDAAKMLLGVEEVVRKIEKDLDNSDQYCTEWLRRLDRSWPAAYFDPIVEDSKFRLGRNSLDTVAFRNRHIDRWRKQLDALEDDFDFEYEATRLVEKVLLDEDSFVLPITGRDIMVALGVKPGPEIGRILERARKYVESNPCGKADLLDHLKSVEVED